MTTTPFGSPNNSTIVRSFKSPIAQRLTLRGVGALSRVAPDLAARLAARVFLTPPRYPAPAREQEILARATPRALRAGGPRIATWSWGTGPRVLLVHGWGGRGGQMGAFVEPLVARGFSVAAFDGPAHGVSEGRTATIPEMAEALTAVMDALGPVRGIVAHSGGGAVSARALRRALLGGFVDVPEAIALVAPAADFRAYFERFMDACDLSAAARVRLERRLEGRVGERPEAFHVPRLGADLPLAALVVHDRDDAEVPWTDGEAVADAWPGAELVTTRGLGHRRILRDSAVVLRVAEFLEARLAGVARHVETPAGVAALC